MFKKMFWLYLLTIVFNYSYALTPSLYVHGYDNSTQSHLEFSQSTDFVTFSEKTFSGVPSICTVLRMQEQGLNSIIQVYCNYTDYLYKSTNGGLSYSVITLPSSITKLGLYSYQEGILTVSGTNDNYYPAGFFESADLGETYSQMSFNGIADLGTYKTIQSIHRQGNSIVVYVFDMEMGSPYLYKSNDNGGTYLSITLPEEIIFVDRVFLTTDKILISGYDWDFNFIQFKESTDLGSSFHNYQPASIDLGNYSVLNCQKQENIELLSLMNNSTGQLEVYYSDTNSSFQRISTISETIDPYASLIYLGLR